MESKLPQIELIKTTLLKELIYPEDPRPPMLETRDVCILVPSPWTVETREDCRVYELTYPEDPRPSIVDTKGESIDPSILLKYPEDPKPSMVEVKESMFNNPNWIPLKYRVDW